MNFNCFFYHFNFNCFFKMWLKKQLP
jgi:hypothetical protein